MKIVDLSKDQIEQIRNDLEEFNDNHVSYRIDGRITIGIEKDGQIIGGLLAYMSVYKILYVDTVFVQEQYRRKGYGKKLMEAMEEKAKQLGANTIRLDTFNWQGKDFYLALNYEQAGYYRNNEEGYEEYFFLKRL